MRIRTPTTLLLAVLLSSPSAAADGGAPPPRRSRLAADESVVLFRTAAWLDPESQSWKVPVHGWVHEPADSRIRKGIVAGVLKLEYGLDVEGEAGEILERRLRHLMADNERGKSLWIRIGDRDHAVPATDAHGHFRGTIALPFSEAERIAVDGSIECSVSTDEEPPRVFRSTVTLVPPRGISVISDIDDTVKISAIDDRAKLLEHALLREFVEAPGMPELYRGRAADGIAVHYVSSSPWQLYPELEAFVDRTGLPAASFHLKRLRFRDTTLLDLFAGGEVTKPAQIEPLLARWPERRFVLVGDSGEHDPEVYAALLRRYPDRIRRVYIRNVTGASADDERFGTLFGDVDPERWRLFTDPAEIGRLSW